MPPKERWSSQTVQNLLQVCTTEIHRSQGDLQHCTTPPEVEIHSAPAAAGLEEMDFSQIRRIVALNPWGEQLLLRLKLHAFSMYDPTSATMRCPHLSCLRVTDITVYHVFWTCPAAILPVLPPEMGKLADTLYPFLSAGLRERLTAAITTAAENRWRIGVALYFHAVWRWRVSHFDAHNDITAPYRSAGLRTRLRRGYQTVVFRTGYGLGSVLTSALASIFYKYLSSAHPEQYRNFRPHGTSQFLLFFVEAPMATQAPVDVGRWWWKWARIQDDDNQFSCEHGALPGLKECAQRRWTPVHVIEDSKLIIRQHISRTTPRAKHLRASYWKIRRLAEQLTVTAWTHHIRTFNRTANALVIMAMDSKRSFQQHQTQATIPGPVWDKVFSMRQEMLNIGTVTIFKRAH
ncbi:hypothetical protein PHMEG_00019883, partial [Phytophthora megakarya]